MIRKVGGTALNRLSLPFEFIFKEVMVTYDFSNLI